MNYFLTYDNACPLFVGGENHGKKVPVKDTYRFCNLGNYILDSPRLRA